MNLTKLHIVYLLAVVGWVFSACKSTSPLQSSSYLQAEDTRLSSPKATLSKPFFKDSMSLPLSFDWEGAKLVYWVDGPSKITERFYEEALVMKEDFILKTLVRHPPFLDSDTLVLEGIRVDNKKDFRLLAIVPSAHEKYAEGGLANLNDRQKALAYTQAKGWLGFQSESVQIDLELEDPLSEFTCIVSCFVNQNAWIFAPESIQLFGSADGQSYEEIGNMGIPAELPKTMQFYFPKIQGQLKDCRYLRLRIKPLAKLPDWHAGAGKRAWLFLDEILLK